jgi:hypothetical protein
MTNDEVDWSCDAEIHYSNLYVVLQCDILTNIKGSATIRKFDEKIQLNLPDEYQKIVKYSKITSEL